MSPSKSEVRHGRARMLDEMTANVESVMIVRFHAQRSDETTEQSRILANAALAALDGFTVEYKLGDDGAGSSPPARRHRTPKQTDRRRATGASLVHGR